MNVERLVATTLITEKVKNLLPNLQDWKDSIGPILRGQRARFIIGVLRDRRPSFPPTLPMPWKRSCPKTLRNLDGVHRGVAGLNLPIMLRRAAP